MAVVTTKIYLVIPTPPTTQILLQPAGVGSEPSNQPAKSTMKGECRVSTFVDGRGRGLVFATSTHPAVETALVDWCWIPFGVQSQLFGPEGGKLYLQPSPGVMGEEEGESILLEVPPESVNPSDSIEVHFAVIPYGPFTLPEGYQLGSMVVYISYDSQRVTRPFRLCLPHWYGGENHVRDGLSFAMAPHTLKEGEHTYQFKLLEGGRRLSSHCWELEIDGHCSLFTKVYRKGAKSCYQAISLQKEIGKATKCDVAVTYAFTLWCDVSSYIHASFVTSYGTEYIYIACMSSSHGICRF